MSNFFYGWYLKCQSDTQTLAVIPAVHRVEISLHALFRLLRKIRHGPLPFRGRFSFGPIEISILEKIALAGKGVSI